MMLIVCQEYLQVLADDTKRNAVGSITKSVSPYMRIYIYRHIRTNIYTCTCSHMHIHEYVPIYMYNMNWIST